uniref:SRCR domain-containing protein n=1 Tax=Oryzias sinensis TaxID=183150 RepID=A0A8C7Y583_9TELE
EVYHKGSWGTVCDNDWDLNDAIVVCRQLSCGTALQAPGSAHFGQGSDPIWLDNVACSGSENSLTECGHRGYEKHNCGHSEDAGATFTLHGSSDPILIFSSNVAQIGYDQGTCKQDKSAWIPIFSDRIQPSSPPFFPLPSGAPKATPPSIAALPP